MASTAAKYPHCVVIDPTYFMNTMASETPCCAQDTSFDYEWKMKQFKQTVIKYRLLKCTDIFCVPTYTSDSVQKMLVVGSIKAIRLVLRREYLDSIAYIIHSVQVRKDKKWIDL